MKFPNFIISNLKSVSVTAFLQITIQAIGLVSGIIIIRLLSVKDYALYTIANTMLSTMILFADSGISTGVMAFGGQVWNDKTKLGEVVSIAFDFRKKFSALSLIIILPILFYLLQKNSTNWQNNLLICLAILPAFYAAINTGIYETVLKLNNESKKLQYFQTASSFLRLILISTSIFFLPLVSIALLAFGLPQLFLNKLLKKESDNFVNHSGVSHALEIKNKYLELVKSNFPGLLYYTFSGQIIVWILSFRGKSLELIGQLGAIGRIGIVMGIIGTIGNILIFPNFAKLKNEKTELFGKLFKFTLILIIPHIVINLLIFCFSDLILAVLGKNYLGLNKELFFYTCTTSIAAFSGYFYSFSSARAWIMNPFLNIPFNIISILIGIFIFKLDNIFSILYFNLFLSASQLLLNFGYLQFKIRKQ